MVNNEEHCFSCPLCKCNKDMSKYRGTPSIADLGCYTCENPTCKYLRGEDAYRKHMEEVHGVYEPKHIKIDGVDHTINEN